MGKGHITGARELAEQLRPGSRGRLRAGKRRQHRAAWGSRGSVSRARVTWHTMGCVPRAWRTGVGVGGPEPETE